MAVYLTLLAPGDTVLGMNLAHGGHLTHGHPLNFSGKLFRIVPYGVRQDDERIDYDEVARLADEHCPKMIMAGASAYPRVIDFARLGAIATSVGAPLVVDMAHIAGLVAAGVHPSPVPHADFVTSTTHKTLRGPRAGLILCRARYAKDLDRTVFPGRAGRAADAHHRGQGGLLQGSRRAGVRDVPAAGGRERPAARGQPVRRRLPPRQRRHRQSPDARRCLLQGRDRQSRRGGARQGWHHRKQERHPVRPEPADGGERHPHRHAGRHHARDARGGDGRHRRSHRPRAPHARRHRRPGDGQGGGRSAVSDVPTASGPARLTTVDEAFADNGPLAQAIEQFEPRAGQLRMARDVASVLADGGVLIAEAGTGTGKTLAYLVPAILSGRRVLVSTGTKNLQEQIYFKDLPALAEALPIRFRATYMKGRANYLCLHRLDQARVSLPPGVVDSIAAWAEVTETGDRAELDDLPDDSGIWQELAATADTCLGNECPQYQQCFVTRMRQRAAEADLVIVNHHLLCADAAVREQSYGEVIPDTQYLVLDEAHQLEDVATQYFGISLSNYRLEELVRDTERAVRHWWRPGSRKRSPARRGARQRSRAGILRQPRHGAPHARPIR